MDFTNEQKQAIYTRGTNLIVSAGAGSERPPFYQNEFYKCYVMDMTLVDY